MIENQRNTGYFPAATDAVENDPVTYSIEPTGAAEQALFELDGTTGELMFKATNIPDYELPADDSADGTNTYNVTITASDGLNNTTQTVTVTVTNADEAPPVFTSGNTISVLENNTTTGYTATATDTDNNGVALTYSLPDPGAEDQTHFSIDPTTGVLSFITAPDYELPTDLDGLNTYIVDIAVNDGSNTTEQTVTVTVTNVNDVAPIFDSGITTTMVENLQNTGYFPAATDTVENDPVTYSIAPTGATEQALFELDGTTGDLSFITAPDYELPTDADGLNTYVVDIAVNDGTNTTAQSVTVTVTDMPLELSVRSGGVKTLTFIWNTYSGATGYKLLVNPDGNSGYMQVGSDITATSMDIEIPVHLTDWINAQYLLEAYDGATLLATSPPMGILDVMINSIGYFKASNTGVGDFFSASSSVSLSADGNTLAVGAFGENSAATGVNNTDIGQGDNSAGNAGAVYIFTRDATTGDWNTDIDTIDYIKASNTEANDRFGFSLSLSADGNTLAVGAYLEDSAATGVNNTDIGQGDNSAGSAGAVYVYTRDPTTKVWNTTIDYIKASNTEAYDGFGGSVSLGADGNTLAVGALGEASRAQGVNDTIFGQGDNSAGGAGAVYVYTRDTAGNWNTVIDTIDYIKASNTEAGDFFGNTLILSADGNTLAVGAYLEDSAATGVNDPFVVLEDNSASGAGAVYVYTRDATTGAWNTDINYIKASNTGAGDTFGRNVNLSADGNTLAVGASGEESAATGVNDTDFGQDDNSASAAGAVYVY